MPALYEDVPELPAGRPHGYPHVYSPETRTDFEQRPWFLNHTPHMADVVATLLYHFEHSGTAFRAFMNPDIQHFTLDRCEGDISVFNAAIVRDGTTVMVRVFSIQFNYVG